MLDDEGARTLQAFGAAEEFLRHTIEGDGARYYDDEGKCFGTVGAGARVYGFAKRHFMYQPELERALVGSLRRFPSAELRFGWTVTGIAQDPSGVTIECDTPDGPHTVRCDWLLACDGGRSSIRQWLGIDFVGSTYEQDWIVLDLKSDSDQVNYSRFFCSTARPAVSVPAPRGGRRFEFMLQDGETGADMLTDESLSKLLAPYRAFRPEDVIRRAIYTFHARIASRMRLGRVLLLGDAAHLTPPFAGQGMNAGLRDAHNVAWKLGLLAKGMADDVHPRQLRRGAPRPGLGHDPAGGRDGPIDYAEGRRASRLARHAAQDAGVVSRRAGLFPANEVQADAALRWRHFRRS